MIYRHIVYHFLSALLLHLCIPAVQAVLFLLPMSKESRAVMQRPAQTMPAAL
jgi:hypothetical protein